MIPALVRTAVVVPLVALALLVFALALLVESLQRPTLPEEQQVTVGTRPYKG
jgi:hypothetical protein